MNTSITVKWSLLCGQVSGVEGIVHYVTVPIHAIDPCARLVDVLPATAAQPGFANRVLFVVEAILTPEQQT